MSPHPFFVVSISLNREKAPLGEWRGCDSGEVPLREPPPGFWGRDGGEPNAGKKSGKNAALDRPAPTRRRGVAGQEGFSKTQ